MRLPLTPNLAFQLVASWVRRVSLLQVLGLVMLQYSSKKGNVYNILWVLVFGFATINILALVGRRLDRETNRMNFGEIVAVLVVVFSVFLLGWEMLYLFKILPIKLSPR